MNSEPILTEIVRNACTGQEQYSIIYFNVLTDYQVNEQD